MKFVKLFVAFFALVASSVNAAAWVEGIPKAVQKSDAAGVNLLFIQMEEPVVYPGEQCDDNNGVIVMDSNESAEAAMTFATTALVAKLKFRCYINTNQCSRYTGAIATFPVCEYYPGLVR